MLGRKRAQTTQLTPRFGQPVRGSGQRPETGSGTEWHQYAVTVQDRTLPFSHCRFLPVREHRAPQEWRVMHCARRQARHREVSQLVEVIGLGGRAPKEHSGVEKSPVTIVSRGHLCRRWRVSSQISGSMRPNLIDFFIGGSGSVVRLRTRNGSGMGVGSVGPDRTAVNAAVAARVDGSSFPPVFLILNLGRP